MATLLAKTTPHTSLLLLATPSHHRISPPASLAEVVQEVVKEVADNKLHAVNVGSCKLTLQPKVMLAVLTYCYARQVYGASDILHYMIRDEAFSRVCQGEFPNPREIEAFRHVNREVIESCLAAALRFQADQKISAGFITRANERFIAEEAKRRIIMAACMDSLELAYENQPCIAVSR